MSNSERAEPSALVAAATSFTLVWAIELALARVTSQIQTWADLAVSAILLVAVPLGLLAALSRLDGSELRRRTLAGVVAALPLVAVAAAIVLPIAYRFAGSGVTALLGVLLAGAVVTNVLAARSGDGPAPSLGMVLGLLVAAAATAWVMSPAGFPPFQVHLPFLLAAVLLARMAVRENGLPLVALGGIAVSFWPAVLPPPPWEGAGVAIERPDIVLITVDGPAAAEVTSLAGFAAIVAEGERFEVRSGGSTREILAEILAVDRARNEPNGTTLAQGLAAGGWDTAAVVAAVPGIDAANDFHRGFAAFHHFIERNRYALPRWRANLAASAEEPVTDFVARPAAADLLTWLGWMSAPSFAGANAVLEVAAQFMSERGAAPVFLWMHLVDDAAAVDVTVLRVLEALQGDAEHARVVALLAMPGRGERTYEMALSPAGDDAAAQRPLTPAEARKRLLAVAAGG